MYRAQVIDYQLLSLSTRRSVSGAICTFDTDRAENLVNLEVAITATGGGGTPDSPIAINGNDHASIFANSINIWNEEIEVGTIDNSTGVPSVDANKKRTKDFIVVKPNTTYSVYNDTGVNLYIYSYGSDKSFIGFDNTGMVTGSTFTTDSDTHYIKFRTQNNPSYNNNISINNDGSTTYHAFSGANIPFGQTIYGGSLNVGSGVLTVTHGYKDLSNLGVTDWAYDSGSGRFYYPYAITDSKHYSASELPNAICSCYPMVKRNDLADKTITVVWNGSANYVLAMDSDYTNANDFKTAITGQKIAYELSTPTTMQLDSKQIQTIANSVNNIYADTGDIIDLKFILTVGKAIS